MRNFLTFKNNQFFDLQRPALPGFAKKCCLPISSYTANVSHLKSTGKPCVARGIPCKMHEIIIGIACCLKSPQTLQWNMKSNSIGKSMYVLPDLPMKSMGKNSCRSYREPYKHFLYLVFEVHMFYCQFCQRPHHLYSSILDYINVLLSLMSNQLLYMFI